MFIDLHCHSTASDGELPAAALLARAAELGLDGLSITDHDTVNAYRQASDLNPHVQLIPGIELSTQWNGVGIHVLGLNIDPYSAAMQEASTRQSTARRERSLKIAHALRKRGLGDALPRVRELAGDGWIGRPHFARYLIEIGAVPDATRAFKRYLGPGKPGDVKHHWADLPQVIEWIRDAGGIATIAHPARYRMTNSKLRRLIQAFKALGGEAIEVVSGSQNPGTTRHLADLCQTYGMLASCGSDFHRTGASWSDLGRFPRLPEGCEPIWRRWD